MPRAKIIKLHVKKQIQADVHKGAFTCIYTHVHCTLKCFMQYKCKILLSINFSVVVISCHIKFACAMKKSWPWLRNSSIIQHVHVLVHYTSSEPEICQKKLLM